LAFLQCSTAMPSADLALEQVIREHIQRVLKAQGGNISKAAQVLAIHRSTLHKKLKEYGLEAEGKN